jgi:hypothetical protein
MLARNFRFSRRIGASQWMDIVHGTHAQQIGRFTVSSENNDVYSFRGDTCMERGARDFLGLVSGWISCMAPTHSNLGDLAQLVNHSGSLADTAIHDR